MGEMQEILELGIFALLWASWGKIKDKKADKAVWEDPGHPFGGQDAKSSQQTLDVTKRTWIERYVLSENFTKRR